MSGTADLEVPLARAPVAKARRRPSRLRRAGVATAWWVASVALFGGLWELAWAMGWAPQLLLPPPHIFLQDFSRQARFFDTSTIGQNQAAPVVAVLTTILATVLRVLAGLALGFVASLATGVLISQFRVVRGLVLPTLTLLAPISPIAWLPVSIFLFGIGNGPAVFMVFVGVYFVMTLATISQINDVSATHLNVARTMGASKGQTLFQVVLPSILPGLLQTLRLNLFAAWMVVLLAEAVGVGSGLGQVVMLARNTFNASLVFFAMTLIGLTGYLLDLLFRQLQKRLLWWQPTAKGAGK
jgi:NitT/TauT family transport system permease protein